MVFSPVGEQHWSLVPIRSMSYCVLPVFDTWSRRRCPALFVAAWPPCQSPTAAPEISPLFRRRRRSKSQPAPDPALGFKAKNKAAAQNTAALFVTSKRCRCHVISAKLKLFILVLMSQLPIRRYPLQSNRLSLD